MMQLPFSAGLCSVQGLKAALAAHSGDSFTVGCCLQFIFLLGHSSLYKAGRGYQIAGQKHGQYCIRPLKGLWESVLHKEIVGGVMVFQSPIFFSLLTEGFFSFLSE